MQYLANLDDDGNFKILMFDADNASTVYHKPNVKSLDEYAVQANLRIYELTKVYKEDSPIQALVEHKTISSLVGFLGSNKEYKLLSLLKK